MYISNAKKTSEDEWDFDLKASADEVEYLVNLAVGVLIINGQVALQEQEQEQEITLDTQEANETSRSLN